MNFATPSEVCSGSLQAWKTKTSLALGPMFVLGILAGAYIALGAQGATMVTHDIAGVGIGRFLSGVVFATGLIMVVIAGAELFTGNVLIWIGVLDGSVTLGKMLRNWFWVYVANFAGSLLVVYLIYLTGLWTFNNNMVGAAAIKIAVAKSSLTFTSALARGIFCNWLVCLAVWMAFAGRDVISKIFGIFFPIMMFIASNFEHSIANMYYIPAGILAKNMPAVLEASKVGAKADVLTWGSFLQNNLLPVTLGNIIGAGVFVATFYWFAYLHGKTTVAPAAEPEKTAAAAAGR